MLNSKLSSFLIEVMLKGSKIPPLVDCIPCDVWGRSRNNKILFSRQNSEVEEFFWQSGLWSNNKTAWCPFNCFDKSQIKVFWKHNAEYIGARYSQAIFHRARHY